MPGVECRREALLAISIVSGFLERLVGLASVSSRFRGRVEDAVDKVGSKAFRLASMLREGGCDEGLVSEIVSFLKGYPELYRRFEDGLKSMEEAGERGLAPLDDDGEDDIIDSFIRVYNEARDTLSRRDPSSG